MAPDPGSSAVLGVGPALPPPLRGRELPVIGAGPLEPALCDSRARLDADIAALDLEPVSYLAVRNEHWDLAKVDLIELEYRCWLQCVRDFPQEPLVPSPDCDLYWHQHILYLGLYLEQTQRLFGRVLLHFPFSGLMGEADAALQEARFLRSRRIVDGLLKRLLRSRSINVELEH